MLKDKNKEIYLSRSIDQRWGGYTWDEWYSIEKSDSKIDLSSMRFNHPYGWFVKCIAKGHV